MKFKATIRKIDIDLQDKLIQKDTESEETVLLSSDENTLSNCVKEK